MLKRIKNILFVICIVMVFTAQSYRTDENAGRKEKGSSHNGQNRPASQAHLESLIQVAPSAPAPTKPAQPQHQPTHQQSQAPRQKGEGSSRERIVP